MATLVDDAGDNWLLDTGPLVALLVTTTPARLPVCRDLMVRYADTPMDFADATLVALAEEFGIGRVLTLDRRGFTTYRWRRSKRFVIAPGR